MLQRAWLRTFTIAAALLTAALIPSPAQANGRFPGAIQLVFRGNTGAMTTSFGFLSSNDKFVTHNWVCERSLGYDPTANNELGAAIFANNTIAVSGPGGLTISSDLSCTNGKAGGVPPTSWFMDVSADEKTPETGIAVSRGGADGQCNGILYETKDNGANWSQLGPALPAGFCPLTVDSAPSDPQRLYLSGNTIGSDGKTVIGQLLVSDDRGKTWATREVPNQLLPFIGAMHPTDKDTVYVRTVNIPASGDLLVSKDAGRTFRTIATLTGVPLQFFGVTGLAVSPDGKKVAYGSVNEGLFVVEGDGQPAKIAEHPIMCLTWTPDALYACSAPNRCGPWFVGRSTDEGKTFTAVLPSVDIQGDKSNCPPTSPTGSMCPADWENIKGKLGDCDAGAGDGGSDAAASDASADAAVITPPPEIGCGCTTASAQGARSTLAIFGVTAAITALVARWRRRR